MTQDERLQRLVEALHAYEGDTGPGCWRVAACDDETVALLYEVQWDTWSQPDFPEPAAPWTRWGGREVAEAAGLILVDSMTDSRLFWAVLE